nr:hypothetical protein [Ktedonobacteraceae bacterium]
MLYTQRNRSTRRVLPPLLLLVLSLGMVVACAQNATTSSSTPTPAPTSQPAIPAITIKAMDFSFDQPQSLPAGPVDITLINNGGVPHQAGIARLKLGMTFEQLKAALLQQGPKALALFAIPVGGANIIMPGQSGEVILNLSPGQYVSVCFVRGADGIPHYAKGMIQTFTVSAPSAQSSLQPPQAAAEIDLRNFAYTLGTIPSGPSVIKVTNDGTQGHEVQIVKLAAGKQEADVLAFLKQPTGHAPFTYVGGMFTLVPGTSGWMKLNLQAGNYVVYCMVPDPITGKPHVMLGMIASFTVQ